MTEKNNAHKYFWVVIMLVAVLVFGMVYFLSVTQAKEKKESQMLENKLNEQITTTKGIEASVRKITDENEILKKDLETSKNEALALYQENKQLEIFVNLQSAYINGDSERCKVIIGSIDPTLLDADNKAVYDKILSEIKTEDKAE